MAKSTGTGMIERVGNTLAPPDWMFKDGDAGMEDLKSFVKPPRLKVIQKQTRKEILDLGYSQGDLIVSPVNELITKMPINPKNNQPIAEDFPRLRITPVFFFAEYVRWNPIELKGQVPAITERTTARNSDLAHKSTTPGLWREPYPGRPDLHINNVEHLNFLLVIHNHPVFNDSPVVASWQKGEHFYGTNFAGLLKMRRAAIFGCVFDMRVQFRDRNGFQWWGLSVENPTESPFIESSERYNELKKAHEEFRQLHSRAMIQTEYDVDDVTIDESTTSKEF